MSTSLAKCKTMQNFQHTVESKPVCLHFLFLCGGFASAMLPPNHGLQARWSIPAWWWSFDSFDNLIYGLSYYSNSSSICMYFSQIPYLWTTSDIVSNLFQSYSIFMHASLSYFFGPQIKHNHTICNHTVRTDGCDHCLFRQCFDLVSTNGLVGVSKHSTVPETLHQRLKTNGPSPQ